MEELSEEEEEKEGKEVGVSVDMKKEKEEEMVTCRPAVLMQAVNMTVFDPAKIFPSTKKEKQVRVEKGDDV